MAPIRPCWHTKVVLVVLLALAAYGGLGALAATVGELTPPLPVWLVLVTGAACVAFWLSTCRCDVPRRGGRNQHRTADWLLRLRRR